MNTHPVEKPVAKTENVQITDPRAAVTEALAAAGHSNPSAWEARLPPYYATAPDDGHRRFLINRTWRLIIGELEEVDTSNERYLLVDNAKISNEDWFLSFSGVIPCAVQHSLPLTRS